MHCFHSYLRKLKVNNYSVLSIEIYSFFDQKNTLVKNNKRINLSNLITINITCIVDFNINWYSIARDKGAVRDSVLSRLGRVECVLQRGPLVDESQALPLLAQQARAHHRAETEET